LELSRAHSHPRALTHTIPTVANPMSSPTTATINTGGNGGVSYRPSSSSSSSPASSTASRSPGIRAVSPSSGTAPSSSQPYSSSSAWGFWGVSSGLSWLIAAGYRQTPAQAAPNASAIASRTSASLGVGTPRSADATVGIPAISGRKSSTVRGPYVITGG
jgi:hypothetical protein